MQSVSERVFTCHRCGVVAKQGARGRPRKYCDECIRSSGYTYERKCDRCGDSFEGPNGSKFCSPECRDRCPVCQPLLVGGRPIVCDECRPMQGRCLNCGSQFDRSRVGRTKLYCGRVCKEEARKVKPPSTSWCLWCFVEYPYAINSSCCSPKCRSARRWQITTYAAPDRCHLPVCKDCGLVYSASRRSVIARDFRCASCAAVYSARVAKSRYRLKDARRRAQMRAGESIDVVEIADRDGWICHLCDEPIDPSLKWPHPGALTLDHVIPLTPYRPGDPPGTHTKDNVRAAHARCNSARCNRPIAEAS